LKDRARCRRVGGGVHHTERPTAQRVTHALGAITDHLDRLRRHGLETGLGHGERIELQLGSERRDQVAEHRRPDHAGEDLERALAPLRFPSPATVEHGELGLVPRRQRHAVEQLTPEHAERLPVLLQLDEHAVAHRRRTVGRGREEV